MSLDNKEKLQADEHPLEALFFYYYGIKICAPGPIGKLNNIQTITKIVQNTPKPIENGIV